MKLKNRLSFSSFSVQNIFISFTFLLFSLNNLFAQTINVPTGSVVIDMGVVPQTINNGLKPYGLAYSLIKDFDTPIIWSIEPTKAKDGIDFTVDGRDFRGGTFIISEEYLSSSVLTEIANWEAQGVVTYTTQSEVTVPLYKELKFFANWVLDESNGSIAADYLNDAGIPVTAYIEKLPNALDACDDLFILPHADPTWANHGLLLQWNDAIANGGNAGYIWSGCHAVSALEDMYNPANPSEQTNFLSTKTVEAFDNGDDYFENALILWGHDSASGTLPYSNAYPGDPFMQFIGQTDEAHAGGSEQIYIPVVGGGWRPSTKIGAWDPNQSDSGPSPREAALIAYGYAFGDPDRGQVMYEGGHTLTNGSEAENVAAQRAFLNFSFDAPAGKVPAIVENSPPATLTLENGDAVSFNITGTPATGGGITYNWSSSCSIGTFDDPTSATPTFTLSATPILTQPEMCTITGQAIDDCGRIAFVSYGFTLIPPPAPPIANDDNYATYNTAPISFNALNNDTDINENIVPSTFIPTSSLTVAGGTFVDNGNGNITFNPTSGFSGTAILTYQICDDTPAIDGGPFCDTATITVTVAGGSCNPGEIVSQETDYAVAVNSENQWSNSDRALGPPDNQYSKANSDAGTGWVILDLGADAYIGSTIKFRIYSDDGNPVSGTIDAAVLTSDFPTAIQTTVNVTTQDPATDIVTLTVNQSGIRYVRVTGATKKFGLESVEFEKEICVVPTVITANDDSGTVTEGVGGIAITNVLANDDLGGSTPTLATVNITQISTTNAGVTLNPSTGEVNVTTGVPAGIYTVEYRICEISTPGNCSTAIVTVEVLPDNDGDGILDQDDLDDDNDGILDTDEQSILDCTTGVSPLFGSAQGPNNYLGSDINNPSVGDSFLYTNVYSGVDAIITIVSSTDTAIVDLDITTTGLDENFQPQINHIDNNSFTEFRIDFVISGTSTPAPVNNFVVTTIDNDVNEFVVYADGHTSNLYIDSPTEELIYTGAAISIGFSEGYISNGNVIGGIPVDAPEFHVAGVYSAVNSVSFRFGSSSGDTSNHSITLLPCIPRDFWTTVPDLYVDIDTDGDGIPNRLDTDSDDDGCFDALEGDGGILVSQLDTNGAIDIANVTPSGVDANGVPNLVSGGQADVSSLNNSVQGPQCLADLSLTKTIDNATPKIGETITYTITVTNSGPSGTSGVQVQDILPSGLLYDSGNSIIPVGTTYNDATGIWDLSSETINNGASYILQIAAKITPACGEITNVAQIINSDKPDPDSITNNGN